ncbi:pimeloyl-ACP methyl ester esterase BioH [Methylomonas sp. LL1]|uniref:pimeloyl-ACP methyl ester esterase BioH n=1 Tax=Methylomonas sp. LL1 TaxID=2785785 RepID=UPI0018C38251|nr:pimeloyl-ACP methyl ester esterase BioH [Methylomonas sp. LL1]QPK65338.1 pimeloyl-ACP methyl ester esterase BioH [Methylomonas sp. LL1]
MTQIHTETYGQGPVLVMIHGWAMHSGVWREFARRLAGHCQVICVDLPGHGRSEAIAPYTLRQVSDALLKAIPVPKFTLLGWSLGATVAMDMADRYPERVKRLIVLAGNPHFVDKQDWPGVKADVLDGFAELLKGDVQQTLVRFLALQVNGLSHGKQLLQTLKLAMQECPPPRSEVLLAGLRILKTSDMREFMLSNRLPVSMIVGDKDMLIPPASGLLLRRLNPGIDLHLLESAGHAPFLSHAEQLISVIGPMV